MEERREDNRRTNKRKPWWTLSALGLFLLSKGKSLLVLLKFSKFGGAFLSMMLTIGAYVLLYPLGFAVGFVALILIHELGHVLATKRKGLPVSAPLFIPFLGAFIAMKKTPPRCRHRSVYRDRRPGPRHGRGAGRLRPRDFP